MASSSPGASAGGAFDWGFKQWKSSFFDSVAVMKAANQFEKLALSKFGAFSRERIRSSMKKAPQANAKTGEIKRGRKKKGVEYKAAISKPGNPPYYHAGDHRKAVRFGYDKATHSVVVGAVKFKRGDVPKLLEFGGRSTDRKGRPTFYKPRPHIFPACKEEAKKFPLTLRSNA